MYKIHIIPALFGHSDNYAYLIEACATRAALLIDVPEAQPILTHINTHNLYLSDVLITHHHHDHVEGLSNFSQELHDDLHVSGAACDAHRLPKLDRELFDRDTITWQDLVIEILAVPGHTSGHLAYYIPALGALFSGDSLMVLGCGRLFEGSYDEAFDSLMRLARLPRDTRLYSGHEYGETNGRFALTLCDDVLTRECNQEVQQKRAQGIPSVPSTLEQEHATNPFLRILDPAYARFLGISSLSEVERFTHVRKLRDQW